MQCGYCQTDAVLRRLGQTGYPYAVDYGPVWVCLFCEAYCGCHEGTEKPLGTLANRELRDARMRAHAAFDPLWKAKMAREQISKSRARKACYFWLATQLGLDVRKTHIAHFDVATCEQVVEACKNWRCE
jgi:hypothetical protein